MVGALVGSPQAKGLFTRAIAQSGGWMGLTMGRMQTTDTAQANGVKAMQALGASTIAELRAKPITDLTMPGGSGLVVDGYLIPEDLSLHLPGRQAERRRRSHRLEQGRSQLRRLCAAPAGAAAARP